MYTCDHDDGSMRLDLAHGWTNTSRPAPILPLDEAVCDPDDGWLCSKLDCKLGEDNEFVRWIPAGPAAMLAVQDDLVVEYDMEMAAPIGVVAFLKGAKVGWMASQ